MQTQLITEKEVREEVGATLDLPCLIEWRVAEEETGIQYRDCLIDYTACPNGKCIKKLV